MVNNELVPIFIHSQKLYSRVLRFFGTASQLATILSEMIDQQSDPTIKFLCKDRVTSTVHRALSQAR